MMFIMIKYNGGEANNATAAQKQLALLNRVLTTIVVAIHHSYDTQPQPHHQVMCMPPPQRSKPDSIRGLGCDSGCVGRWPADVACCLLPRPQRGYFRLLSNLFVELTTADSLLEGLQYQILSSLSNALHLLQPARVPAMAFAWLELLAHRSFMPKIMLFKGQKVCGIMHGYFLAYAPATNILPPVNYP